MVATINGIIYLSNSEKKNEGRPPPHLNGTFVTTQLPQHYAYLPREGTNVFNIIHSRIRFYILQSTLEAYH